MLFRHLAKDVFELLGIALPVVWRNTYAEQDHGRTGGFANTDDRVEIALDAARRKAAQAIVAAEFEDNQRRIERLDGAGDPRRPAFGRFAANTGVHHAMFVPLFLQTILQQRCPGLVNINPESGTEAVAKYEDGRGFCATGNGANKH